MIHTCLTSEMLVVVGPMGRDIAAFASPDHAYGWTRAMLGGEHYSYRRPDGATIRHGDLATINALARWANDWEEPK